MVVVGQGGSNALLDATLKTMFEDRKAVFVDLLKWSVPVVDGRFEVDQFDDEHATYLVVADRSGDHLGSARLLPTNRPHILGDLFANLCAVPPPKGNQVFEITRFCLSRRLRSQQRLHVRNQLVSALVTHALEASIATYTGVAELAWLQQILAFGWDCRPLGPPAPFDGGMLGALAIEIDEETPARLASSGLWEIDGDPVSYLPQAA